MSICRKVKIDFDYSIDKNILTRVTEFIDIGITITTKLSWCENVKTVSPKDHCMVEMIKRSVGFNSPIDVKRQLIWPMSEVFLSTVVRCGVQLMLKT